MKQTQKYLLVTVLAIVGVQAQSRQHYIMPDAAASQAETQREALVQASHERPLTPVRQTEAEFYRSRGACHMVGGTGNTTLSVCETPSETKRIGAISRSIRCKNCNVAFYQDAVE